MTRTLILAAALLTIAPVAGAYAQGVASTPNTDIRALEAPADVRPQQLRAQDQYGIQQGRSVYRAEPNDSPLENNQGGR